MKAYKGFNQDMTCRGFQYKEGETYETEKAELCKEGFHACEDPLDCFCYYAPANSVYHEVELENVNAQREDDTKIVGKRIKIGAALDVAGLCKAHFEFVKEHMTNSDNGKGFSSLAAQDSSSLAAQDSSSLAAQDSSSLAAQDWSSLAAQDSSSLAAQDRSSLAAQDRSSLAARNSSSLAAQDSSSLAAQDRSSLAAGKNSVLAAFNSRAKADIGSIILLANRNDDFTITDFAVAVVDGKTILPNVWYKVENGKFVPSEDDKCSK